MKVRSRRTVPQAARVFTDREEPRASFWKNYNEYKRRMLDDGDIRVLTYYGIGGIGKSTLLKKLMAEMDEKIGKPLYVYYDFNLKQESRAVLENLKNKLSDQYQFTFPLFELGVYIYAKKIGEDVSSPEVKAFIDRSPLLNLAISAVGSIPVVGMVTQIMSIADKGLAYARNLVEQHKRDLAEIEYSDPADLYQRLPYLFAQDLANNLEDTQEPLVVFLDTYEQLVNEMSSVGEPLDDDIWIRGPEGLVQNIPNVLWVIAGREKIKWERFDKDWCNAIEQHILGTLSQADATQFLNCAGITDAELVEGIYSLTKGTPVYLDLCVDRYLSLLDAGRKPQPSDFGQDIYSLIQRFARYMDDRKKDVVYVLSCLQQWDDALIMEVGPRVIPAFSITTYEKVKDFSFIIQSDKGLYNIHQTVGEVLFESCPQIIRDKCFRQARDYYHQTLSNIDVFSAEYEYSLRRLICFALKDCASDRGFLDYYNKNIYDYIDKLTMHGKYAAVVNLYEPIMQRVARGENSILYATILGHLSLIYRSMGHYADAREWSGKALAVYEALWLEESEAYVGALIDYAVNLRLLGQYREALEYNERAYELAKNILPEEHSAYIRAEASLSNILNSMGRYREAIELCEHVLEKRCNLLGEDHADTLKSLESMADCYENIGDYHKAFELRKKCYQLMKDNFGELDLRTISAIGGLADSYGMLGEYQKALELSEQVLAKRQELLGESHPKTISAMYNLAVIYDELGDYQKALKLRESVLAKRRDLLGESHPDTISAMNSLTSSYKAMGEYQKALELSEQVLAKRQELLGESHPVTISAMYNLAVIYDELGDYQKALKLRESVLEKRLELLGESHPSTFSAMLGLASGFERLGDYQKALKLRESTLEKRRELLGESHPATIGAMNDLANSYVNLGEYQKALKLRESVLAKRRDLLGESHPDTISAMHNLAITYHSLGEYREALEQEKAVLAKRRELLGESHPDTISAMKTLALSYVKLGEIQRALEMKKVVMIKSRESFGESHIETIGALNSYVWACYEMRKLEEALAYVEGLHRIVDNSELPENKKIIFYDTVAWVYYDAGRINEAERIAKELYDMVMVNSKYTPSFVGDRQYLLASVHRRQNAWGEANRYAQEAYESYFAAYGEGHTETLKAKALIDEIRSHI